MPLTLTVFLPRCSAAPACAAKASNANPADRYRNRFAAAFTRFFMLILPVQRSQNDLVPSGAASQCHLLERVVASHLTLVASCCTSDTCTVSQARLPRAAEVAFCRATLSAGLPRDPAT